MRRVSFHALFLCAAAHALSACGEASAGPGHTTARSDDQLRAFELDAVAESDAGSDEARALRIDVRVPGSKGLIGARVSTDPVAQIEVLAYPTVAQLEAHHGPLPVGFDGAFGASYCASVRSQAEKASGKHAGARWYKQQVRSAGGVSLNLPVSPFVGPDFQIALRTAAQAAGSDSHAFVLGNPLLLEHASLHLALDDGAMSHLIGETVGLEAEQQSYLTQQLPAVVQSGVFVTALSAKDVLCDLAQGHAQVVFEVEGSDAGQPYAGQTTLQNLK